MNIRTKATAAAFLSAVLYGVSVPLSKLLMGEVPPALMSALLYLGAGIGMAAFLIVRRVLSRGRGEQNASAAIAAHEAPLTRKEAPTCFFMVVVNAASALLLMFGIAGSNAACASLLGNFEIVATAIIAFLVFHEDMGKRLVLAIVAITLSCAVLSFEGAESLSFSPAALLIIGACMLWGLENNLTKVLSEKDPIEVTCVKGIGSGALALLVAFALGQAAAPLFSCLLALLLGFFAYGISIALYVWAQRTLGATRTGNYYTCAPFAGVAFSWLFFGFDWTWQFAVGLVLMVVGFWLTMSAIHEHAHVHPALEHEHVHSHNDGHHLHKHEGIDASMSHSHLHLHEEITHKHPHTPDIHHVHEH